MQTPDANLSRAIQWLNRIDQRVSTYREDVRQRLTKGVDPDIKERLADGFALGTEAFREQVRHLAKGGREITQTRELRRRVAFTDLLAMVETLRGEKVEDLLHQRGDWARPILLWAARRYTGMTLREIGAAAGGADYTAVAMTIKRVLLSIFLIWFLANGKSGGRGRNGILHMTRILDTGGCVEYLHANDIAVLVVVQNDAWLLFVALLDWGLTEKNPQHINFRIIRNFHDCL